MADSPDKSPHDADRPSDQAAPKKPYSKPRLETYGDLLKITNTVGGHGVSDNRVITFIRTHS